MQNSVSRPHRKSGYLAAVAILVLRRVRKTVFGNYYLASIEYCLIFASEQGGLGMFCLKPLRIAAS